MSAGTILLERDDPIVPVVRIGQPAKRNAMTLDMWRQLGEAFTELADDADARCIILAGAGGHFCSGADISEFGEVRSTPEQGEAYEAVVEACGEAIATIGKPTIAAISGICIGGGFALAQTCDFRVAEPGATFAIPAARLGIVYSRQECQTLLSLVGLAKAKEILFTAERFDGAEAHRIGFVDRLTAAGADPLGPARDFARRMSANAPLAIKGAKLMLNALAAGEGDAQARALADIGLQALASDDYKEGVAAFAERRVPRFSGR